MAIAVLPGLAAQTAPPAPTFDRAAWQADYAALKTELEQRYANLAWFASPQGGVDLPALDRYTEATLAIANNDGQAASAIGNFVRSFHDDHFSALPMLQPGIAEASPPAISLTGMDAAAGCAALGYTSDMRVSFSAPFESLPGFHMTSDGLSSAFRAGEMTLDDGRKLGIVRIHNFHQNQYPHLCLSAWNTLQQSSKAIDLDTLQKEVETSWYIALATQLKHFHDDGVAAVLVDIGQNNGGNDSGDAAARLFTARPVRSSLLLISQSAEASGYLDEQISEMQTALSLKPSPAIASLLHSHLAVFTDSKKQASRPRAMHWVWHIRRDWKTNACKRLIPAGTSGGPAGYLPPTRDADNESARRLHWPLAMQRQWAAWTGPVYVLTDAKTYSAAEMFAVVMRNNGIARTVGATTGGAGCGFMIDAKPVVLPHSHLRFRIPNCIRLRADDSDEVAGIAPDLPVLPFEGENKRAWATRILRTVDDDLKMSR
ncbi:Peptidase family S41 [Dyella sp. OK004]|nr:Peptidase family S41 [Dyella sp. OK004]